MKRGEIIFLILSLVIIITGTVIYLDAAAFQKKAGVTEGIVVSDNISFYTVRYITTDGVERMHKSNQSKNGKHHEGDKFKVFYLLNNPDTSRLSDGKVGGRTTIIAGIALLCLFLVSNYQRRSREKRINLYKSKRRAVRAEITSIETDLNTTIMEKHPYIVRCRWVDPISGREYTATVDQLWKDPTPLLAGQNYIDVYIDRDDPEKYFLDTEFLGDIKAY
jgi:hypothetical protein